MNNSYAITKKIMHKVAVVQENRLKRTLKFGLPIVSIVVAVFLFALARTVTDIMSKELISIFDGLEFDLETLPLLLWDNLAASWEFIEKGPVFLSVGSLLLATLMFVKINPWSILRQVKEITKYKSA